MSQSTRCVPPESVDILDLASAGDSSFVGLFEQFVATSKYSRSFALLLIEVARGLRGNSWEVRCLAALMLQEHLLSVPAANTREFEIVLADLGFKLASDGRMPSRAIKEGYGHVDLPGFVREFRRRLARPRCAVQPRRPECITSASVREFVLQSRQPCKLALARHLFSAEEVVARLHLHVKRSAGVPVVNTDDDLLHDTNSVIAELPDYEATILRALRSVPCAYWVADATPSELNSLVEYPVGTVVLVVKPPGSHYEFEWKRVGRRGEHPLSVRSHVPASHRLDGGSMLTALQWDATATALLNHVYRYVHNRPAPISKIVHITAKSGVPIGEREHPILEFLTHRSIYGDGYNEMRKAMRIVVECFRQERDHVVPAIPGDYGLTAQFMALAGPAQATICGSSSFRLDLIAKYLSASGPDDYFRRGLNTAYEDVDAKRLADDLLDEALGVYEPPNINYHDHELYVAAALANPRNRSRANGVYAGLLEQIGTMWGTLLGMRGYSFGESFVARNVGLRTIWTEGHWCVMLIFQDHDNLVVPDQSQAELWPMSALPSTVLDDLYINGRDGYDNLEWELHSLRRIYRVEQDVQDSARKRMRKALKNAYVKTQFAMMFDPRVRSRFDERFIKKLRDWDAVARIYLARDRSVNSNDWKARVRRFLQTRGYHDSSIADHCGALEQHGEFVENFSFLYCSRTPTPRNASHSRNGSATSPNQSRSRSASHSKLL
jgi:hypothetical protein